MATPIPKSIKKRKAPRAWLSVHLDYRDIPEAGGCYAIYMDGELVYIGQTGNLRERLKGGHGLRSILNGDAFVTPWGICKRAFAKIKVGKRYGEWLMREARLLRRLKPRHNYNAVGVYGRQRAKGFDVRGFLG